MNLSMVNVTITAVPRSSYNVEAENIVGILMFVTFIASLVISPMLVIYFAKVYCCMKRDASSYRIGIDDIETSVQCVGEKKGILMEDHFKIVEAENPLLGRSAASSMDHGYLADYIMCEAISQQADCSDM
jgi:hypothetical protein